MTIRIHVLLCVALFGSWHSYAESQNNDYKGITDPFGDPANYEFADDEKEDKEFFHLGKYLMFGVDVGGAVFTGGLGTTTEPGFSVGAHLIYFFDRSIAFEAAGHYSSHFELIEPMNASADLSVDVTVVPITLGFRFYFDTRDAPKAVSVANPYLAFGAGVYLRTITGDLEGSSSNFGVYGGAGIEFLVYRRHVYLGLDLRYHLVFFNDEADTIEGLVGEGARAGDYLTPNISITYNF